MKTVFITGVSRGIGRALAEKFLDESWHVLGTSQTGSVDYQNDRLTVFPLDLASSESINRACVEIDRSGSKIHILINNAGALFDEDETSVVIDKLRKTLEVNLIGTIDFTEHVIPNMEKDSHIINISSSAGSLEKTVGHLESSHYPYHYPAYKISKAALNMYTKTLATRLHHAGSGVIVSSVHPGWVKTDMGGEDADMNPTEAAEHIFKLAISKPETGQFWFKGEKYPW